MLISLIATPLIGSIIIASISQNFKGYDLIIRKIALHTSIIVLLVSSFLFIPFISVLPSLYNFSEYKFISLGISLTRLGDVKLGLDGLSLIFVVLTTYLMPLAILSTYATVTHNARSQLICLLLVESLLIIAFSSLDLIVFYVSFEAVLVPLFVIIGLHGSTKERIRASMLLFIYTLTGSFFMLLGIMKLLSVTGTSDMILLSLKIQLIPSDTGRWIWLGIFFGIAVKTPLVPLHGWLFRGHAEASLAGSIVLAGIILKLATYAYLRMLIPILPEACEYFRPLALTFAAFSLLHSSLATIRQVDTKVYIAYASVAHMSIIILGLASNTIDGIHGAVLLSVAHGLISPALFILVGGVLYDRYHTRTIRYFRGLGSFMPSFKTLFFLASVASMATPGSLNWIGELLCIVGGFKVSPIAGCIATSSVLLGAIYTIWLFNGLSGGHVSPYLALTNDITHREWIMLIFLIFPSFILGIFPYILTSLTTIFITLL